MTGKDRAIIGMFFVLVMKFIAIQLHIEPYTEKSDIDLLSKQIDNMAKNIDEWTEEN
jgi:hypothetical protein